MTREDILGGLKEIISIIRPKTDISGVRFESELIKDLGIDSLTMMLLALAVEEKYQMRFPADKPAPVTVGDVCDGVIEALGA